MSSNNDTNYVGTVYNKIKDMYYKPEAINDIQVDANTTKIIDDITVYQKNNCDPISKEPTCKIDDKDIEHISKFLTHIIPKCKKTNITLDDIKNGKILSKGAFGYSFIAGDNIIKIAVCKENNNNMEKEINVHKELTSIDTNIFIKLKGYFKRDSDNIYKYYNYSDIEHNYEIENCNFELNYDKICETYLFLERGKYDLQKVTKIVNYNSDNSEQKKTFLEKIETISDLKIVDKFDNLLSIYKLLFKNKGRVFIHSDIKTSNIIESNDGKYKFIDFGTSFFSDKFFNNAVGGTPNIFKLLVDDNFVKKMYIPDDIVVSPLYDLFSILYSFFEIFVGRKVVNIGGLKDVVLRYLLEYPDNNKYPKEKQKIYIMFYLLDMIHNFYNNVMKEYEKYRILYDNIYNSGITNSFNNRIYKLVSPLLSSPKQQLEHVLTFFDMENFNLIETDYFINTGLNFADKPIYTNLYPNKLKNDIIYLDKIMAYLFGFKEEESITF